VLFEAGHSNVADEGLKCCKRLIIISSCGRRDRVTRLFFCNTTKGNGRHLFKYLISSRGHYPIAGVLLNKKGRKNIWQDFF
jgi:hypothetical protein